MTIVLHVKTEKITSQKLASKKKNTICTSTKLLHNKSHAEIEKYVLFSSFPIRIKCPVYPNSSLDV